MICNVPCDGVPVQGFAVVFERADPHIGAELNISLAIADYIGSGAIPVGTLQIFLHQPDLRFAAGAVFVREVRADQNVREMNPLGTQYIQNEILGDFKILLRKTVGAQAVLVAYHDQFIAGGLQFEQCRDYTWFKSDLAEGVNLFIIGLRHQGTVAVYK